MHKIFVVSQNLALEFLLALPSLQFAKIIFYSRLEQSTVKDFSSDM